MKIALVLLCCHLVSAWAGQAPYAARATNIPSSGRDRVYLADQTSGTVSVVNPATNTFLGSIKLGNSLADSLVATYRGQLLVHGMGFSPDRRTIAVVCVGSNAVVFIDTATNKIKHTAYVGRAPHEAMWTQDGKEVWVAVRGQDYIQVLDGTTYRQLRRIKVPDGPGMTIFSPDGRYAYICSSFTPETVIINTKTYAIVGRVKQASTFCPNIAASPDGSQVWFTLKDSGKTQVFEARPPFRMLATLETGPITNHVNFAVTPAGQFAYVTIGGENAVKVFTTDFAKAGSKKQGTTAQPGPRLVATIPLTGDNPHGLWPSGDGSRMYVGLQLGNGVTAIDTTTNKLVATVPIQGQAPMAVVYVPGAVPDEASGTSGSESKRSNLVLDSAGASGSLHVGMVSPASAAAGAGMRLQGRRTSVAVNKQGLVDSLELAVAGLQPGKQYAVALAGSMEGSKGKLEPVVSFKAAADGAASVAVIGPFRQALTAKGGSKKYLVIIPYDGAAGKVVGPEVQVQQQAELVPAGAALMGGAAGSPAAARTIGGGALSSTMVVVRGK